MKSKINLLSFALACLFIFNHLYADEVNEQQKLGLVLSGGGAKGFAHIGVLKVLEEENIPISLISGTSIGNIIGALYSIGYNAAEIEEFVKEQDWSMLLTDDIDRRLKSRFKQDFEEKHPLELSLNKKQKKLLLPAGLVKGNNILNTFCGLMTHYPDNIDFSELPIPFSCVAYDLESAQEVVINSGHLPKAVLSSMAIPGIFSPVEFGDNRFVDGGVINNFPVDVALDMGADIIIGVDLKQEGEKDQAVGESITTILRGIVYKLESQKHNENREKADVVIIPDLKGITALDFDANLVDSIISKGEQAARKHLSEIRELVKNREILRNNNYNRKSKDNWHITDVELPDLYKKETKIILQQLNIDPGTSYDLEQLDKAVKRVYGYGNFETVFYKLIPNDKGYTMKVLIENKPETALMVGGALNTVDIAAVYANFSHRDYSRAINLMSIDAKIARSPQLLLMAETNRLLSTTGVKVKSRFHRMDFHSDDKISGRMRAGSVIASLYSYRRFRESADLSIGIDEAYFYSNDYYRSAAGFDDSKVSSFYTSANASFTIDNRNKSFIPDRGIFLNANFSLIAENSNFDFKNLIPVASLTFNGLIPVSENVYFKTDLYHRTVFFDFSGSPYFSNYSSNRYNAFSDFYFPLLGQGGVTILDNVSSLGDLGLRIEVAPKHYIIPRVQLLWQLDKWSNLNFDNRYWGGGFTYQHRSRLSRIDFTIGYSELLGRANFHGGIGYQF